MFVSSNAAKSEAALNTNINAMKSLMEAVEQGVKDQKKLEETEWKNIELNKKLDLSQNSMET